MDINPEPVIFYKIMSSYRGGTLLNPRYKSEFFFLVHTPNSCLYNMCVGGVEKCHQQSIKFNLVFN